MIKNQLKVLVPLFIFMFLFHALTFSQSKKEQVINLQNQIEEKSDSIKYLQQEFLNLKDSLAIINDGFQELIHNAELEINTLEKELQVESLNARKLRSNLMACEAWKTQLENEVRAFDFGDFSLTMKYVDFDPGHEWEGTLHFLTFTEGGWYDDWFLNLDYGEMGYEFLTEKLMVGEIYEVTIGIGSNNFTGGVQFEFEYARRSTDSEIQAATAY